MAWSGNTRFLVWIFFQYGFLQLCSAEDLVCSVTQSHGQTVFTVTLLNVPDVNTSDCEFSWSNGADGIVIAHHEGKKDDVVKSRNITTLITSQCFPSIIYQLNCVLQGVYYANCTVISNPESVKPEETSNIWIVVVPVSVISVILVMSVICLCYIFRDKIRQRIFYTHVGQKDGEKGNL